MNAWEKFIEDIHLSRRVIFQTNAFNFDEIAKIEQESQLFLKNVNRAIKEFKKTGKIPSQSEIDGWDTKEYEEDETITEKVAIKAEKECIPKENIKPEKESPEVERQRPRTRRQKKALLENETVSTNEDGRSTDLPSIKTERETMPAPKKRAPRGRNLKAVDNQVVIKKEVETTVRESDVVIKEQKIEVIDLDSSTEDRTLKNSTIEAQQASKRSRNESPEEKTVSKKTKSNELVAPASDTSFVATASNLNATVILDHPQVLTKKINQPTMDDLMTDDESDSDTKTDPKKKSSTIPKRIKQVFSTFDSSPVKQKVQAFEKLTSKIGIHKDSNRKEPASRTLVQEKAKLFTPVVSNKFQPKITSTASKSRTPIQQENSILNSTSTLRNTREERDLEFLKKKEARLAAQSESNRKKREEKQLKAQQVREAMEKEKAKQLEAQLLKDEQRRKLIAEERDARLQKAKAEMEKKRQLAKYRAMEEKKKELEMKERQKAEMPQRPPLYMHTQPPLLPTSDCYDSDDENYKGKREEWPEFSEKNLIAKQMTAAAIVDSIKNTFFCIQAQTPDLEEIFQVISPKKLKRNSSAVWRNKPEYSRCPALDSHDETEEFDDF